VPIHKNATTNFKYINEIKRLILQIIVQTFDLEDCYPFLTDKDEILNCWRVAYYLSYYHTETDTYPLYRQRYWPRRQDAVLVTVKSTKIVFNLLLQQKLIMSRLLSAKTKYNMLLFYVLVLLFP
jgi:hypothetical protein